MSNSPLVAFTRISPNRTAPRNHVIDTVTIHCVVGQCSVEALGELFAYESRQASCNYGVGVDGRIGMYCEEKDRSWCSSNRDNDHRAITIEVASDTTHPYGVNSAAYNALIDLLVDICKRNPSIGTLKWKGDKSLIGQPAEQNMTVHRWFANKACPGEWLYSRHAQIAAEVNARLGQSAEHPVEKPDKPIETKPSVVSGFKKGDLVSLTSDATYYNGSEVPAWVLRKKWYVKKDASGDRVVIDKSQDGKNAINSPVNAKHLKLVEAKTELPYMVQVSISDLNVRKGPGTNYASVGVTGKGIFTITAIQNGAGSDSGWGKLKSNMGWISLDYCKKI